MALDIFISVVFFVYCLVWLGFAFIYKQKIVNVLVNKQKTADGCCDCFSVSADNITKINATNLVGRLYLEVMLRNYDEHKCVLVFKQKTIIRVSQLLTKHLLLFSYILANETYFINHL